MGRPKAAATPKPVEPVRYRVNTVELAPGTEPAWAELSPWSNVEKYLHGAGWLPIYPAKPIMAAEVGHLDPRTNRIHLKGPIWPPPAPS